MYEKLQLEEEIRVDPRHLGRDVEDSIRRSIAQTHEGEIHDRIGVMLAVTNVDDIGDGDIEPEDAGVYYPVTYSALAFNPELHEIVEGEVVDLTEFGAFVRIGPIDGLCHISQVMEDYVNYNEEQHQLEGEEGDRILQEGDVVRARVTAVSLGDDGDNKVNLTMRQEGLGKKEWIAEDFEEDEDEEDDD